MKKFKELIEEIEIEDLEANLGAVSEEEFLDVVDEIMELGPDAIEEAYYCLIEMLAEGSVEEFDIEESADLTIGDIVVNEEDILEDETLEEARARIFKNKKKGKRWFKTKTKQQMDRDKRRRRTELRKQRIRNRRMLRKTKIQRSKYNKSYRDRIKRGQHQSKKHRGSR
jgi:hypothetical protein